jgi:hypothetical protein
MLDYIFGGAARPNDQEILKQKLADQRREKKMKNQE